MINILDIDHLVLRTDKCEAMVRFYTEVLGCHIERETDAEMGLTQLRAGYALIDLVDVDSQLGARGGDAPSMKNNNLDHFCLRISTITEDALLAHLQRHGINNEGFQIRYGSEGFGPSIYIQDPQGNTVELRCELGDGD